MLSLNKNVYSKQECYLQTGMSRIDKDVIFKQDSDL